jgi:hypothetical protein
MTAMQQTSRLSRSLLSIYVTADVANGYERVPAELANAGLTTTTLALQYARAARGCATVGELRKHRRHGTQECAEGDAACLRELEFG